MTAIACLLVHKSACISQQIDARCKPHALGTDTRFKPYGSTDKFIHI